MAYEIRGTDVAYQAAEALTTHQYRFVVLASDSTVQMANAAGDYPVGVLQNAPASGEIAVVRIAGVTKLVANTAITRGSLLKNEYVGAADNGKADAADTDKDLARAVAIQAAGAEDDVFAALLINSKISV